MTASLEKILLATDGSESAAPAERAAADISNKTAAELHLVHVGPYVPPPAYPAVVFDDQRDSGREAADQLLRRVSWEARLVGARVAGQHLREGRAAEEVTDLARNLGADLVVVGSRRAGRLKRIVAGSVSEGIAHRAACPVLVVCGGDWAWPVRGVVVADDGSEASGRAGDLAARIAALSGAEVVVVRAYEHPPEPVGGWSARERRELDGTLSRNRRDLRRRAERLEEIARRRPKTRLVRSKAAPAVELVAEEVEKGPTLFAVGSRGLAAPLRALLGSVSTQTLRAADGSVLIVPSEAAAARRSAARGQRVV